jgi:Mu-like prophage I protein
MSSAEKNSGRTLEDAPAVHWKPLTVPNRGSNSKRCEPLVTALQSQLIMKNNHFNSFFKRLRDVGWLGQRESVANSATTPAREAAVCNSLDAGDAIDLTDDSDGWFKISPYGEFRGTQPGKNQYVDTASAEAMVSEFNSLLGKLGRAFRGVPIYHGHPDVDLALWPDDKRMGKITQLEARADGLWGLAEWNSSGRENKAEGWWIYPSPRWDAPAGGTRFSPDRLISVGLTNTPRIQESEPIFNSHPTDTNTTDTMDPALLRTKLGLPPEATDEDVLAKIDSLTAAAVAEETTETAAEKAAETMANSLATATGEITSLRTAHNTLLLDGAAADGRITAAERPAWELRLAGANRAEEMNSLAALTPKLNRKGLNLSDRRADRAESDDLREQVANSVSQLQKSEGLSYSDAWKKAKKDPAFKTYFQGSEG